MESQIIQKSLEARNTHGLNRITKTGKGHNILHKHYIKIYCLFGNIREELITSSVLIVVHFSRNRSVFCVINVIGIKLMFFLVLFYYVMETFSPARVFIPDFMDGPCCSSF
jgi:hypothetical protein